MLRSFFIYLSKLHWMRDLILRLVFARKASRRFVAGETCQDAVGVIAAQAQQNILSTIDHLGESVETEAQARQAAQDYMDVLDCIAASGVTSHVSLKLTQFGLDVSGDQPAGYRGAARACKRRRAAEVTGSDPSK